MLWLVVVLAVTNLATLAVIVVERRRPLPDLGDDAEVFEAPRPPGMRERERRVITVEILNPIELARGRMGRVAAVAGSIVPGLTRRVVYDQTVRTLRQELTTQAVYADVRVHVLRTVPRGERSSRRPEGSPRVVELDVVDEVAPLDLSDPKA